ncbi:FGGY-family carbohydrate kinase [Labrys wisconsinensis]|uniref:Sugar (Pentulose or hexulose) kinase n=1 Tax=Labrys wisconsinensis TaxID=425677 RepID=A0ABU0J660_9HYPH|nr:FGGY family carbohydrate kinase [Labrys wisconsinensis]MDQ0469125.1 sugar (pentulose or hexulose) kinase [Labrys wisconsinensis]
MSGSDAILVGIDIGTTNLKAVALHPDGRVAAVVRRPMVVRSGGAGATEFDLDALDRDLLGALRELVDRLAAEGVAPVRIAGIGVASIGESFVGLDREGRRVSPCPTWYDRRTTNRRADWGLSPAHWFEITGMVDDDIYTVHRIGWWRTAGADWPGRVHRWMLVADYATFLLCGQVVGSPSLAARSGLADRRDGRWSGEILGHAGLDVASLPELRPAGSPAGTLLREVGKATGLPVGLPVVNAGHDHPCAGLGCGLVDPGGMIDSTGTSEALKTVVDRALTYDEVGGGRYDCYPHAVPGRFLLSGHVPASGGLLDWLVKLLSGPSPAPDAVRELWRLAALSPPGANGVRVAPFLQGTGAPWNQRARRAGIASLGGASGPGDVLRAGVEALAAWLAVNLEAFEAIAGVRPRQVTLAGGGARNALANAIKAAFLDRPFVIPDVAEAAGAGAALVAGLGVGLFPDATAAAALGGIGRQAVPVDPALAAAYAGLRDEIVLHLKAEAGAHG